jgi:hypothetical protein
MLQRNATDHVLDVPAIPATVQPGDTVDHEWPIVGFEPVEPDPEPSPPKTARKAAATAGEEQAR